MLGLLTVLVALIYSIILIAIFIVVFLKLRYLDYHMYILSDIQNSLIEKISDKEENI